MAKPEKIMKKCQACKGKGEISGKMVHGTGKKSIKCPWCKGKGFLFNPPSK